MSKLPLAPDRCVHFTGVHNATCGAGVNYDTVRDTSERPYRWPCCETTTTSCEKRLLPTPKQISDEADASELEEVALGSADEPPGREPR